MSIEKLRALLAEATPGPWVAEDKAVHLGVTRAPDATDEWYDSLGRIYDEGGHSALDAALIAAMHEALPALLDVAEAARPIARDAADDGIEDPGLVELIDALARLDSES